jgi:hypothetical protein
MPREEPSIHPGVAQRAYNRSTRPKPSVPTFPLAFSTGRRIDTDPLRATGPTHPRPAKPRQALTQCLGLALRGRMVNMTRSTTGFQRFPLSNFKYFLTLFSKFFSSFPHGTCSLSVSRQYLALDEIYHPFRAALSSNSTLRTHVVRGELQDKNGIVTLSDTLFQRICSWVTR